MLSRHDGIASGSKSSRPLKPQPARDGLEIPGPDEVCDPRFHPDGAPSCVEARDGPLDRGTPGNNLGSEAAHRGLRWHPPPWLFEPLKPNSPVSALLQDLAVKCGSSSRVCQPHLA